MRRSTLDVPAAVLSVVLFETAAGGLALLWLGPTWGAVRHGYEILLATTLGLMALGAWAAARAPLDVLDAAVGSAAVGLTSTGMVVTAALAGVSVLSLLARQALLGRIAGLLSAGVAVVTLLPLAQVRVLASADDASTALGLLELLCGAFFLGAVWDGMILGHWYLVERRLSNRYMVWIAWANVAAVAAGLASVLLSLRNQVPCEGLSGDALTVCSFTYSPILLIEGFTVYMGVGLVALVALIAGFNVKLAREGGRSIQASTGMFYLAVILAPAAEFAAKVRFF